MQYLFSIIIINPVTKVQTMKVAEKAEAGSVILAMLPDTGERYLSTYLFEAMNEGSDDDWLEALSN